MKTLKDLTPEIRSKINVYKEKCIKDLYSGVEYKNYDRSKLVNYIEKIYELAHKEKPVVIIANDPVDYRKKFNLLQDKNTLKTVYNIFLKKNNLTSDLINNFKIHKKSAIKSHYLFICSSYHRVYFMWYKFIQDEFKIKHKNKEILNWLYDNGNNNIARCYFTNLYVLVLRMPQYIKRNTVGFNCIDGPAIEWENYGIYYINGRKISKKIFDSVLAETFTFNDFIAETNEDIKASIITLISEKFGHEKLKSFLNATVIDEKVINHSSGYTETVRIWKTKQSFPFLSDANGNLNQPYAWLELKCPSSGSIYMIPTSPHFTDAVEACCFHRPQLIPSELKYNFTLFNN